MGSKVAKIAARAALAVVASGVLVVTNTMMNRLIEQNARNLSETLERRQEKREAA